MKDALELISAAFDRLCRWGAASFFIAMLVMVIVQVVARYIFRAPPTWTEELARYFMVWGGLLGATVAYRRRVDPKLVDVSQLKNRSIILTARFLRAAATLIFLSPVLYYSGSFLSRHTQRTGETFEISTVWLALSIPVMIIVILTHLASHLAGNEPDEP